MPLSAWTRFALSIHKRVFIIKVRTNHIPAPRAKPAFYDAYSSRLGGVQIHLQWTYRLRKSQCPRAKRLSTPVPPHTRSESLFLLDNAYRHLSSSGCEVQSRGMIDWLHNHFWSLMHTAGLFAMRSFHKTPQSHHLLNSANQMLIQLVGVSETTHILI